MLCHAADFDGRATFAFLQPSRLAFRRLSWQEELGPTIIIFLIAAIFAPLTFFCWLFIAPAGPRFPWNIDWVDPAKGESIPREFCSWLLAIVLAINAAVAVSLVVLLPWATHTGAPDLWYTRCDKTDG